MTAGQYGARVKVSTDRSCGEVSRLLGRMPDECHEKGTRMSPRNPASMVRERAVWLLGSGLPDDEPLEAHLRAVLDSVGQRLSALPAGDDVVLFCLVSAAESTLAAAVLGEIAAAGATLVLDVYLEGSGSGKRTAATFTTAAGDVWRSGAAPHVPPARHVEELASRYPVDPSGRWTIAYTSETGQGAIEFDPVVLRQLADIGAPLTIRLGGPAP